MMHLKHLAPVAAVAFSLMLAPSASAQEAERPTASPGTSPGTSEDQILKSMGQMLKRAELIRMLAAIHLNHINSEDDKTDVRLMDDATQVLAYNLVCEDETFEIRMLNKIAAETTLKIAMKVDGSPVEAAMADALGNLTPQERLTLVADVSSTVLMFKIGRRRGLFDALLTDFGNQRFCKGLGAAMRDRYHSMAAYLGDDPKED